MMDTVYRFFALSKVSLLLALVLMAAACRKLVEPEKGEPILFGCHTVEVETRADDGIYVGEETIPSNQHFAVYAWDTGNQFLSNDPVTNFGAPALMNGLDVTYVNNSDKGKHNTYTGDHFWPLTRDPEYCYSFFAYYPLAAGSGITPPVISAGNVGQYAFTAKSSVNQMVDFCVSDVSNDVVYGTTYSAYPGTVGLTFHHALTRVQVRLIKSRDVDEDTHIYITDAKLVNIRTTGTLTVSYGQFIDDVTDPEHPAAAPGFGRKGTTSLNWLTNPDICADYDISLYGTDPNPDATPDPVEVEIQYQQPVGVGEVFLMVPQNIQMVSEPSPQAITFNWKLGDAPQEPATLILDECVKAIGSSVKAGITAWGPNMSIVYTVVIKAKPIEFALTASIRKWDDESGYHTIIP